MNINLFCLKYKEYTKTVDGEGGVEEKNGIDKTGAQGLGIGEMKGKG